MVNSLIVLHLQRGLADLYKPKLVIEGYVIAGLVVSKAPSCFCSHCADRQDGRAQAGRWWTR